MKVKTSLSVKIARELSSMHLGRRHYGITGHAMNHLSTTHFSTKPKSFPTGTGTDMRSFSTNASNSNLSLQDRGIFDSRDLLLFNTLHEVQVRASIAFADNPLFGTYEEQDDGKGKFVWMTYKEFGEKVNECRLVLKNFGVEKYGKVGIISNNRWEWVVIATAAYSLSATLVPMYEAQSPTDWTYIINDSGCSVVFTANQVIHDRYTNEVFSQTLGVKAVSCLSAKEGEEHAFATYMNEAAKQLQHKVDLSSNIIIAPTPEDLANLLYTSGTTGKPKGVELLHSNITSNVKGIRGMVPEDEVHDFIRSTDRGLAILPWAHSYGQTCELWTDIVHGASIGICRGIPTLLEDLEMVRPCTLVAVPTLFKKIYSGVYNTMEQANPVRKTLMKKAFELGKKNVDANNSGVPLGFLENLQFKALDSLVLSKVRDKFGGRLRHGFVAGSACPPEVLHFMDEIGVPICEGYGLTETAPIIAMNTPKNRCIGTVGRKLVGVEVVIMGDDGVPVADGEEGEICCYGPNVMRGYYNNPEATADVITVAPDGKSRLFHSGDLGLMTPEGYLKVTGRLKELYKLDNGKYVCPTPIEETISMSRFVNQVVLCGANKPYNVALIVPDWPAIRTKLKIDESVKEEELMDDDRVKALIQGEVDSRCMNKVKKFEIPKAFGFVEPFTAENNMITPKMSIRRHIVVKTYQDFVERMYSENGEN